MRPSLVVLALVIVTACHRPRPPSLFSSGNKRMLDAAKNLLATQQALATFQAATQQAAPAPASDPEPTPEPRRSTPAPAPAPAPGPTIVEHRVTAAKPTQFVLHGTTHGGKASCTSYPTMDECTRSCTGMLKATMLRKPAPGDTRSCSCNELDGGC